MWAAVMAGGVVSGTTSSTGAGLELWAPFPNTSNTAESDVGTTDNGARVKARRRGAAESVSDKRRPSLLPLLLPLPLPLLPLLLPLLPPLPLPSEPSATTHKPSAPTTKPDAHVVEAANVGAWFAASRATAARVGSSRAY